MSDNFVAPWGVCISSDEIGGCHHLRTKLTFGTDGSYVDVSSGNPLPVSIISGGGSSSGGLTDAELRASPVPVSGTFYPATQPVSGTVGISGSVAVTGPLTDAQLRATALPVSGTFWQATQPVSIASTVNVSIQNASLAVTGPLTDAQLRAAAVPVSGTFWQATQPVSIAATVAVSGPLTDTQLRASAVPVSAPTITKATQGANGFTTQDLKDAGRVIKIYSGTFTAATTEGLVTLTPIADGVAGAAGTSFTVPAGKRLRLQSLSVSTKNAGAAGQGVVCNLRITSTGAVTASSPLAATCGAGTYLAIANVVGGNTVLFPDGLELSGNMQLGISQIGTATAGNTVTLVGYEY